VSDKGKHDPEVLCIKYFRILFRNQLLIHFKVLEDRDRARIYAEVSNEGKLRTLSNILQYKTEDSFSKLLCALDETSNKHVADHLRQQEKTAQEKCGKMNGKINILGCQCQCRHKLPLRPT
jgi:hypothetical protein